MAEIDGIDQANLMLMFLTVGGMLNCFMVGLLYS